MVNVLFQKLQNKQHLLSTKICEYASKEADPRAVWHILLNKQTQKQRVI